MGGAVHEDAMGECGADPRERFERRGIGRIHVEWAARVRGERPSRGSRAGRRGLIRGRGTRSTRARRASPAPLCAAAALTRRVRGVDDVELVLEREPVGGRGWARAGGIPDSEGAGASPGGGEEGEKPEGVPFGGRHSGHGTRAAARRMHQNVAEWGGSSPKTHPGPGPG